MRGRRRDSGGAHLNGIGALADAIHGGDDIVVGYPGSKVGVGVAQGRRVGEDCVSATAGGGSLELIVHSAGGERPGQEEIAPGSNAQTGGGRGKRRRAGGGWGRERHT